MDKEDVIMLAVVFVVMVELGKLWFLATIAYFCRELVARTPPFKAEEPEESFE